MLSDGREESITVAPPNSIVDQRKPNRGLVGEVEVTDGLKRREASVPRRLLQTSLLPMSDLLGR